MRKVGANVGILFYEEPVKKKKKRKMFEDGIAYNNSSNVLLLRKNRLNIKSGTLFTEKQISVLPLKKKKPRVSFTIK